MNDLLYPLLAVGDLVFLFLIFLFVKRGRLSVRFSLAWFALGGVLLVFAAFPLVAKMLRGLLRFEVVSNMVFTMLFGFVLLVLLWDSLFWPPQPASRPTHNTPASRRESAFFIL